MTDDSGVADDSGEGSTDGSADEPTKTIRKASATPTLRVTKRHGLPGWMGRPVHDRFPVRRSTLLLVLLFAGFEALHIQYPSTPPVQKNTNIPAGYVPVVTPITAPSTTTVTPTSTSTTQPAHSSSTTSTVVTGGNGSTTTTTKGPSSSSTSTTSLGGSGTTTTSTSQPSSQGNSTTSTTSPG